MIRVAINGFGRIGRTAAKIMLEQPKAFQLVAINDLTNPENLAYLMQYDTVYGQYQKLVEATKGGLKIDRHTIEVSAEKDPAKLPWKEKKIDVVIESTGIFTKGEDAKKHLEAGAKAVVISAPSKGDEPAPTFLRGVNDGEYDGETLINNASCTTNCIAPTIQVLEDAFGVDQSLMTTVHAYTASQAIEDGPNHHDLRRGRAAAQNIVPTSTGAAIATTEAIPSLRGKFNGVALRVPVPVGSIADVTAVLKQEATVEEVNQAFRDAARSKRFKNILTTIEEPVVSSDIIGDPHSAIIDLSFTQVAGNLVKVFAWYDNEYGYSNRLVEMVEQLGKARR